jgi:hypothetical protein
LCYFSAKLNSALKVTKIAYTQARPPKTGFRDQLICIKICAALAACALFNKILPLALATNAENSAQENLAHNFA